MLRGVELALMAANAIVMYREQVSSGRTTPKGAALQMTIGGVLAALFLVVRVWLAPYKKALAVFYGAVLLSPVWIVWILYRRHKHRQRGM
ncbi:MAG: hypothetical protein ACRDFX_09115 [Chloroflexota bacterium]